MATCINMNHPDFLKLTKESGLNRGTLAGMMGSWMDENNTEEWPTLNQLGIETNQIKPGIEELFDSNPELANQVYESLGFQFNDYTGIGNEDLDNLIDDNLNVNWDLLDKLQNELFSKEAKWTLRNRPEKHSGEKYTWEHIQNVVESAKKIPIPANVDRKVLVLAALLHDIGKPYRNEDHALDSAKVINRLFKDNKYSKLVKLAVRHHMISTKTTKDEYINIIEDAHKNGIKVDDFIELLLALNVADITRNREDTIIDDFSNKSIKETLLEEIPLKRKGLKSITPQQKQQALQLYSQYLDTGRQDIEGFKEFTKKDNIQFNKESPEVQYQLKAIDILLSDKAKQVFTKGNKNGWSLDKILTELAIPKEQKQLLLDLNIKDREELAVELAAKYAFAVEMNIATLKDGNPHQNNENEYPTFELDGKYYTRNGGYFLIDSSSDFNNAEIILTDEYYEALNKANIQQPTQQHKNLSARDKNNNVKYEGNPDWSYKEIQINAPLIEPSTKGHTAPFDNDNGIGWIRVWTNEKTGEVEIQEIQSDLFQKGRNKNRLIGREFEKVQPVGRIDIVKKQLNELEKGIIPDFFNSYTNFNGILPQAESVFQYKNQLVIWQNDEYDSKVQPFVKGELENQHGVKFWILKDKLQKELIDKYKIKLQKEIDNQSNLEREEFLRVEKINKQIEKENEEFLSQNQFLQLLNKDNNWVTFFIKATVQNFAKQGYTTIRFPKGETAAKIEGHETIADEIKKIDSEIEETKLKEEKAFDEDDERALSRAGIKLAQLEKQKLNLKTQGIEKLKPIEAFYEIKVGNILEKQFGKDNVKEVADEVGNEWREIEIKPERDLKNIQLNKEPKTYKSLTTTESNVKTIADRFKSKLGINYEFISEDGARKLLGNKYNGEPGFYYKGKTYFVNGKLSEKTTIHEFGHPFIDALYVKNKGLFDALYSKLSKTQEGQDIVFEVLKLYPEYIGSDGEINNDDFYKEVMVRSLTKAALSKDSSGNSKFLRLVSRLMDFISEMMHKLFGKTINLAQLDVNTSMNDLTRLFLNKNKIEGVGIGGDVQFNKEENLQLEIANALFENSKKIQLITKDEKGADAHFYKKGTKEIKNTFSQVAHDFFSSFKSFKKQASSSNFYSETGTKIHKFAEEALKEITQPDYVHELDLSDSIDSESFKTVKKALEGLVKNIKDRDVKQGLDTPMFFTELSIFDENIIWEDSKGAKHKGLAGTIDLLIIHSDGSASIYDFKTSSKSEISDSDMAVYNKQVSLIKYALSKGDAVSGIPPIKKFQRTRILPINTKFKKNGENTYLAGVSFESADIPVANETTGNQKLDDYISMLSKKRDKLAKNKSLGSFEDRVEKERLLKSVTETIDTLIREKTINSVIENIDSQVDYIESKLNQSNQELKESNIIRLKEELNSYGLIKELINKDDKPEQVELITKLVGRIEALNTAILNRISDLATDEITERGYDATKISDGLTSYSSLLRDMSQYDEAHINTFSKLVQTQLRSIEKKTDTFNDRLKKEISLLRKSGSQSKIFDMMIREVGGHLKLVSKIDAKFYEAEETARNKNDEQWFADTYELKIEEIQKELKIKATAINLMKPGDAKDRAVKAYDRYKFINSNPMTAYKKFKSIKSSAEEKWLSQEYKALKNNPDAFRFYNFYVDSMKEFRKIIPDFGESNSFMAQVRADFTEQFSKANSDSIRGTKEYFRDLYSFRMNEDTTMGVYENGKRVYTVPVFYTKKLDAKDASRDLGVSLQLFAEMAYKYEAMSTIEPTALILLENLKTRKAYETTYSGKYKTENNERVVSEAANKKYVDSMIDFLNYYVYGIGTKEEGPMSKVVSTLSKITTGQSLALNISSGLIAASQNAIGIQEEIVKSTHFSGKDFNDAHKAFFGATQKSEVAMVRFIDPNPENNRVWKRNKNSKNHFIGKFNPDWLYIQLKTPDQVMYAGVTGAMARNYYIVEDGRIVSKANLRRRFLPAGFYALDKSKKDLIEKEIETKIAQYKTFREAAQFDEKTGELSFIGIKPTDDSIAGFRMAIREVARNISGALDGGNIARYRLSAIGRALALFKNWMPRQLDKRYGSLRKNQTLDEYELGKYITFFKKITETVVNEAGETQLALTMGIDEYARMKYRKMVNEGTDKGISENEFVELTRANIKASVHGIAMTALMIAGLIALSLAFDDDDDDLNEKGLLYKFASRNVSELMMWVNPAEALKFFKSPTSIVAPFNNAYGLVTSVWKEGYATYTGNDEMLKRNKVTYHIMKNFKGSAVVRTMYDNSERFYDYINEDE